MHEFVNDTPTNPELGRADQLHRTSDSISIRRHNESKTTYIKNFVNFAVNEDKHLIPLFESSIWNLLTRCCVTQTETNTKQQHSPSIVKGENKEETSLVSVVTCLFRLFHPRTAVTHSAVTHVS